MPGKNKSYVLGLQARIMLFLSGAIFLTIGIGTLLYVNNFKKNYLQAIEWRSVSLAGSISAEVRSRYEQFARFSSLEGTHLLLETSYLQCKKLYEANARNHVAFISVLAPNGTIVIHNDRSLWGKSLLGKEITAYLHNPQTATLLIGEDYHTLIPVKTDTNKLIGIIDIGFPKQVVDEKVMDIIIYAITFLCIIYLLKFLLFWFYIKYIVDRPINLLVQATNDIAGGNLQRDMHVSKAREFVELSDSLTHMRDVIRQNIQKLEFANQEIKALIACSPVALLSISMTKEVTIWTSSAERQFGWTGQEVINRQLPIIQKEEEPRFTALCGETSSGKVLQAQEFQLLRKDHATFPGSLSLAAIYDEKDRITGIMISAEDISQRVEREKSHHEMEAQLIQAQKMESVGRLAGGVAHDYNNMLGVILGNAELTLNKMEENDPNRRYIQQIVTAAHHSADITRQLLAFARKQPISLEIIDLNSCVENMLKMLHRLLGETVELQWHPQAAICMVKMDKTQVNQILANLCINARDAMPAGGTITIETRSVYVDHNYIDTHREFKPGNYICLSVSDTGTGIDRTLREKVFEPFFTTKNKGEGTGLGLATVYGIIKQNNGFINLYSEPGQGTAFHIYIAEAPEQSIAGSTNDAPETIRNNGETILIVEDEPAILELCTTILTDFGFRVLSSDHPHTALTLLENIQEPIDLLITDVIMPEMDGQELSKKLQRVFPGLKTLYMSGYTSDVIARHGMIEGPIHFIQKPFSQRDLIKKLKETLSRQAEQVQ